ncbi:MAG: hypothetical protein ACO3T6_05860 [Candidatus Nanopelagicaceae bacterium]
MTFLSSKYKGNYANSKDDRVNQDCKGIEKKSVVKRSCVIESLELVEPATCDCSGSARVSPGAIPGSYDSTFLKVKASNLALMDIPTVVPARSGRRKSLDLSIFTLSVMSNDCHGVTSFDFVNFMPTNFMPSKWIYNYQTFVVEDDGWMKKDLVSDSSAKNAPNTGYRSARYSVIKEVNVGECSEKEESQIGKHIGTRRSKKFSIVHEEIFPCDTEKGAA